MTKQKKFQRLVSQEKTDSIAKNRARIKNRKQLRESQAIALKVLDKLDELGWTQRKFATEMDVSPQQISKIVSGKENLTLATLIRLQDLLDIPVLATYFEKEQKTTQSKITLKAQAKYGWQEIFSNDFHTTTESNKTAEVSKETCLFNLEKKVYQTFEKQEPWTIAL